MAEEGATACAEGLEAVTSEYTTYGCPVCAQQHPLGRECGALPKIVRAIVRDMWRPSYTQHEVVLPDGTHDPKNCAYCEGVAQRAWNDAIDAVLKMVQGTSDARPDFLEHHRACAAISDAVRNLRGPPTPLGRWPKKPGDMLKLGDMNQGPITERIPTRPLPPDPMRDPDPWKECERLRAERDKWRDKWRDLYEEERKRGA